MDNVDLGLAMRQPLPRLGVTYPVEDISSDDLNVQIECGGVARDHRAQLPRERHR